jgi:uncharacterized repeat protein (TIGR01451 family)
MRRIFGIALVVLSVVVTALPLAVAPAHAACQVSLTPWDPSNYRLPDGRPGVAYSTSIKASGGTNGQYFWQLTGGSLPPGLAHSPLGPAGDTFTISGTPTTWGVYGIQIVAYDAPGGTINSSCAGRGGNYALNVPMANLAVSQSVAPNPVKAGQQLTYSVDVINYGEFDAPHSVLTDTLPAETRLVTATYTPYGKTAQSCSAASGKVTCNLGTLRDNRVSDDSRGTATIVVKTLSAGTVTNVADVSSAAYDDVTSNNHSSMDAIVDPASADVDASLIAGVDEVHNEDVVHYRFSVGNHGPDAAEDVIAKVTFNDPVSVESAESPVGQCSVNNQDVVRCEVGRLARDSDVRGRLVVHTHQAGRLVATAHAHSDTPDPEQANNEDKAVVHVTRVADLKVKSIDAPGRAGIGDDFQLTIKVANATDSPDNARDVKVYVYVSGPARVRPHGESESDCAGVAGAADLLCREENLGPAEFASYDFAVHPKDVGIVTIRVRARSVTYDPDTSNNTRSREVTITK